MFGKIKNAMGKVKEFFLEAKIEEKTKTTLDEGIAAVKKSSEELVETLGKVSEAAAKNHESLKDTVGRVVDAVKNKPADIKETEKIIDDATHSHATSDLAKDIGLSPICSNNATSDALKEAEKIKKDKVVKTDCKSFKKKCVIDEVAAEKTSKNKCVIDEVAAEKSVEAMAPKYKTGAYSKVETTSIESLIKDGTTDPVEIAALLHRNPVNVAKKVKQVMSDMQYNA